MRRNTVYHAIQESDSWYSAQSPRTLRGCRTYLNGSDGTMQRNIEGGVIGLPGQPWVRCGDTLLVDKGRDMNHWLGQNGPTLFL